MRAIVSAIAWLFGKIVGDNMLRFVATKALLVALVVVVIPVILNNLIYELMDIVLTVAKDHLSSTGIESKLLSVTGVAAWLMTTCKVPESFSIIVSALTVRASLNLIPFVRI